MLTKERIEAKGRALLSAGDAPLFVGGFIEGATWANAKNAQEIAELKDNIRNLNITIENAAEWSEKQRSFEQKYGEMAPIIKRLGDEFTAKLEAGLAL